MKFGIMIAALMFAAPVVSFAADNDILVRRNDGRYERVVPSTNSPSGGYYTRPEGNTYTGVYDRRGDRVGTVKSDAAGSRFYDNRGNRK